MCWWVDSRADKTKDGWRWTEVVDGNSVFHECQSWQMNGATDVRGAEASDDGEARRQISERSIVDMRILNVSE